MAAPTYAYGSKKLVLAVGGADGNIASSYDTFTALFIQNSSTDSGDGYFNSSDSTEVKISKIKELFKLDGFRIVYVSNIPSFIGYCLQNGANMEYHNPSRVSKLPTPSALSLDVLLFNDAGLNIKSKPIASSSNANASVATNGFIISALFKAPFYNPITSYGVQWKLSTEEIWNTFEIGLNINEKEQIEIVSSSYNIDVTEFLYIEAFKTYNLRAYCTTSEGSLYFNYLSQTPNAAPISLCYSSISPAQAYSSTPLTFYKSKKTLTTVVDSFIYTESTVPNPANNGYYLDKSNPIGVNQYRYYQLTDGKVVNVGVYTYVPWVQVAYSAYATTYSAALALAESNSWGVIASIYRNDTTGIYYTVSGGSTIVADGYYMISRYENEDPFYLYIINGIAQ